MVAAFVTDFVGVVAFFAMVFFTAVTVVFFFGGIVLGPPLSLSLSLTIVSALVSILDDSQSAFSREEPLTDPQSRGFSSDLSVSLNVSWGMQVR